jgi:hypothetical protein
MSVFHVSIGREQKRFWFSLRAALLVESAPWVDAASHNGLRRLLGYPYQETI